MDNLIDQLRATAHAVRTDRATIETVAGRMEQAADTIEALTTTNANQSRLLALAETLAVEAKKCKDAPGQPCYTDLLALSNAAIAFDKAQAEYQATGTVPCGECEAKDRKVKAFDTESQVLFERAQRAEAERDDLRRQLAEAQQLHSDVRALMVQYKDERDAIMGNHAIYQAERDKAQADNAALVEALAGASKWAASQGMAALVVMINKVLSQPHPGAPLLEEVAALRSGLDRLAGIIPYQHCRTCDLMAQEIDAIRNREAGHGR